MQCPKCGFAMGPFDEECPRCKRQAQQAPSPGTPVAEAMCCLHCGGALIPEVGKQEPPPFCGHCGKATSVPKPKEAGFVGYVVLALVVVGVGWFILRSVHQTSQAGRQANESYKEAVEFQGQAASHYDDQDAQKEAASRTWVQVASWSGDGIKSTEKFTVGDEWAIEWATQPGQYGDMNFIIHISDGDVAANIIGPGHDISYKHQPGTYYLEINSGQLWQIKVWEKR